jgi:hypothetical protein
VLPEISMRAPTMTAPEESWMVPEIVWERRRIGARTSNKNEAAFIEGG